MPPAGIFSTLELQNRKITIHSLLSPSSAITASVLAHIHILYRTAEPGHAGMVTSFCMYNDTIVLCHQ